MRRGIAAALLLLPVAEIALAVAVGRLIGAGATLLVLLGLSLVGVLLLRETGRRGWDEMRAAAREGVLPDQSSGRGGRGLTMVAAVLLAVPGFLTAFAGLVLLLPPVRGLVRSRVRRWAELQGAWIVADRSGSGRRTPPNPSGRRSASGDVVEGEVLDD